MRRRLFSTFVLALLLVAAFAKPYKVTASKLNVRSTPDASGAVLGSLTQGSQVEVNRISGGWAEITFKGKKAYISAQYIAPVSGTTASSKGTTAQNNKSGKNNLPPQNPRKNKGNTAQNNRGSSNSGKNHMPPQNPRKNKGSMPPQNPRKAGNTAQNGKKGGQALAENSIEESKLKGFRATFDTRWSMYSGTFRDGTTGAFQARNIGADKKLISGFTAGFGFEYNALVYKMSAANIMVGGRTGFAYDYCGSGSFKGTMAGQQISGRCSYHSFTFPLQPQLTFEWMAGSMNMGFGFFTGPVFQAYFMRNLWKFGTGGESGLDMGVENYVTGHILGTGGGTIPDERRSGSFNCMWDTGIFLQLNTFRFFFSTAWGIHNFAWTRGGNGVTPVQAHLSRPVAFGFQTLLGAKHKKKKK